MPVSPSTALSLSAFDLGSPSVVALAVVVETAVIVRGVYTRRPTHVVLAAVAVPCLLVSVWAVATALYPSGGVYWGGALSAAAGGLVMFLVVVDAAVGLLVRSRDSEATLCF